MNEENNENSEPVSKAYKLNELVTIDTTEEGILKAFSPAGVESIKTLLREKALDFESDISTPKGIKLIKSQASKVSKSKTYLDGIGKAYVTPIKQSCKGVDGGRSDLRAFCDDLKQVILAPVIEWEKKQAEKAAQIESGIQNIINLSNSVDSLGYSLTIENLQDRLQQVQAIEIDERWCEFELKAYKTKKQSIEVLNNRIAELEAIKKVDLENERLRLEKEEADKKETDRIKKEHEKDIAEAAAKKAKQDAEEKAKRDALQKEIDHKNQLAKEKLDREKLEQDKRESEARIIQLQKESEEREKAATEREKQRQIEASAERARVQSERDNNRRIQARVNNKAMNFLTVEFGISEKLATRIIKSIAMGEVPAVSIKY